MILSRKATDAETKVFFDGLNKKHQKKGFTLNNACFPISSEAWLEEGYRIEEYALDDNEWGVHIPRITISSSSDKTFHLFICFLKLFKKMVKVSLKRYYSRNQKHQKFSISNIDPILLRSLLWDYENFLTSDGCAGIAVSNRKTGLTVILNEHKYLVIYNWIIFKKNILAILENNGIRRKQNSRLVCEMKHCHCSLRNFQEQLKELRTVLKEMSP